MKKSIQLLFVILSLGIAATFAYADNNSGVTFSNITKTSQKPAMAADGENPRITRLSESGIATSR
jgi:hypothetical protein